MLALVKTPHIELSINGEGLEKFIKYISRKYPIEIINPESEELIEVKSSGFWKMIEKNKAGNLLAGYRLKKGLTQKQLSEDVNVKQSVISDYERGKRRISKRMAGVFGKALETNPENFINQ